METIRRKRILNRSGYEDTLAVRGCRNALTKPSRMHHPRIRGLAQDPRSETAQQNTHMVAERC